MSEILHRTREELEELADSRGLTAFVPEEDELFLDLDSVSIRDAVSIALSKQGLEPIGRLFTTSVHGNTHCYIKLDRELDAMSRVALQAALGSDPVKEALSVLRHELGGDAPCSLFETEEEAGAVNKWRIQMARYKALNESIQRSARATRGPA